MAIASGQLPDDLRGSGLGILTTAQSITRLVGSLAFGALWTLAGLQTAVLVFGAGLAVAIAVSARLLTRP